MKELPRKLIAPALLLAALFLPFAVAEGQRRRPRPLPPGRQVPEQQTQVGNQKVVVRRVNQARLSAAAIQTIRSLPLLQGAVAARGTTIRPLSGSSLWRLPNGGYLLVVGGTDEPEVYAAEIYTHETPAGVVVWACYCPGYDANKDDGCRFDGLPRATVCKQTRGVNCTCKFQDFLIHYDGSVIGFETAT